MTRPVIPLMGKCNQQNVFLHINLNSLPVPSHLLCPLELQRLSYLLSTCQLFNHLLCIFIICSVKIDPQAPTQSLPPGPGPTPELIVISPAQALATSFINFQRMYYLVLNATGVEPVVSGPGAHPPLTLEKNREE